jgi:hypothetical protein
VSFERDNFFAPAFRHSAMCVPLSSRKSQPLNATPMIATMMKNKILMIQNGGRAQALTQD